MVTPAQLILKPIQRRTDNGYSYEHFISHSEPLYSSFYPRTVRDWNSLHPNVVSIGCLETFAATVEKQQPVIPS